MVPLLHRAAITKERKKERKKERSYMAKILGEE